MNEEMPQRGPQPRPDGRDPGPTPGDFFPHLDGERAPGPVRVPDVPTQDVEPLPSDWDDRARALADSFISPRILHPEETADLERFSHAGLRYAYLERRVQGDVLCELPAHVSVIQGGQHASLLDEAEALAEEERRCFGIPDGPIEDLAELLDDRGIKVFEWPRVSPRSPAGAFIMDEETGPALLSLAPSGSAVGRFIIAHEYCHLVADIDPYENRFCPLVDGELGPGGRLLHEVEPQDAFDETNLPESRSDLFARCLLVPRDHFARTLRDFGQGGADGFDPSRLADVAFYYGVRPEVILCRLVDIEILTPTAATALALRLPPPENGGRAPASPTSALPPRFLNLSLAMLLKGRISREQMGALLGTGEEGVRRILAWLGPGRHPGPSKKAD